MNQKDFALLQGYFSQVTSGLAQIQSMLGVAQSQRPDDPIAPAAPTLLPYDFDGKPDFDQAGICTADWWMRGKPGCMKGALYAHWQNYKQITTMMGSVTEFDVVCAPDPVNAVEMNPSNYNACVHHAWEPMVGWVKEVPAYLVTPSEVTAEIEAGRAAWYKTFLAAHGLTP